MSTLPFADLARRSGIASGRPILRYSSISVEAVAQRFALGESVDRIAEDYGVDPYAIESAIRLVVWCKGGHLGQSKAIQDRLDRVLPLEDA